MGVQPWYIHGFTWYDLTLCKLHPHTTVSCNKCQWFVQVASYSRAVPSFQVYKTRFFSSVTLLWECPLASLLVFSLNLFMVILTRHRYPYWCRVPFSQCTSSFPSIPLWPSVFSTNLQSQNVLSPLTDHTGFYNCACKYFDYCLIVSVETNEGFS